MFHNVPCCLNSTRHPPFLSGCASALGDAPATCCCLASQLRFCSSKALELPRRNHWGEEGILGGVLWIFILQPPQKMGRHLNHFDPENMEMYLSFFWGGDASPQKWIGMDLGSWLFETHPTSCERGILWNPTSPVPIQDASRTGGCGLIERLLLPLVFSNRWGQESTYCTLLLLSA